MASVSVKEEPLECEVDTESNNQLSGGSEPLNKIKREDDGPMTPRDGSEARIKRRKDFHNSSCQTEAKDGDGEHPESRDSDEDFHLEIMKIEPGNLSEEDGEDEINDGIGKARSQMPADIQNISQSSRSVQIQSRVPKSAGKAQNAEMERLYICSDCGKDFFGESEFKAHQQIHSKSNAESDVDGGSETQPIRPEVKAAFVCSHCGKGFARKGELSRHQFIHTGQKPFSCSVCGNCFATKCQRTAHQKIHTGEKPFSCSHCGKTFARKGELTVHQKRHNGDKPFSCSQCGKGFTTKGEVTVHQRRHVGEKPFGCSYCRRSFGTRDQLTQHPCVPLEGKL